MSTSRFLPRSLCTVRTCRDCGGAGEIEYPGPFGSSPYDVAHACESCGGTGRIAFRDPDVLDRLRYQRTYGATSSFYRESRKRAFRRVPLPGSRYLQAVLEAEAFRRAERADSYRQTICDAMSVRGAA